MKVVHQQHPALRGPTAAGRTTGSRRVRPQPCGRPGDCQRRGKRRPTAAQRGSGDRGHHAFWRGSVQFGPDEASAGQIPGPVGARDRRPMRHHCAVCRPVWPAWPRSKGPCGHLPGEERLESPGPSCQRDCPAEAPPRRSRSDTGNAAPAGGPHQYAGGPISPAPASFSISWRCVQGRHTGSTRVAHLTKA